VTPVSRETGDRPEAPPAPLAARGVFGSGRLELAERYAAWLAGDGVVRGLIGPREVPRLWERHLLGCAVVSAAIPQGSTVADVGTGAGLPGLVLAVARPDLRITLVEPLLRRTTFLAEVVEDLGLEHVDVVRARAEELHGSRAFDVVTSRAVAPLERLVGWCLPLAGPSGAVLAMKGSRAGQEVDAAEQTLRRLQCAPPEIMTVGGGEPAYLDPPTTLVRVVRCQPGVRG
jgi:16S rRNA (guanine527-N7)-methyltransferase